MAFIILSMDVSGGASRIRRAINDVAGTRELLIICYQSLNNNVEFLHVDLTPVRSLSSSHALAGVENVDVYPDTGRVVVTGWADAEEVVTALEKRLRVTVTIVNRHEPALEFSSDEDDSDDESSSSSDDYYYEQGQPANLEDWWPWNPTGEWHGMGLPAIRTREPWAADQPVPDPSSWFFNLNLGNNSEDDD